MPMDEDRGFNLAWWEERVAVHAGSQIYDLAAYADPTHLSRVARYDLPHLGDLAGVDLVHLQCHIGTETVSFARCGARVTGVDFSPAAVEVARQLAGDAGVDAEFVESELYDAPAALAGRTFDLAYTSVGALCWLPDIVGWAQVVAALLRPGGRLFVRDAHPMLMAVADDRDDDLLVLTHPYFEPAVPNTWYDTTTYADPDARFDHADTREWNHALSELVTAVLGSGLEVTALREHTDCEWQALPSMVVGDDGRWRLPDRADRLPLMFTLEARRP